MGKSNELISSDSVVTQASVLTSAEIKIFEAEVIDIELSPVDTVDIGKVKFTKFTDAGREFSGYAYPLLPHIKDYPVLHEVIVVLVFFGSYFYITPLNFNNMINNNVFDSATATKTKTSAKSYSSVGASGVPTTNNTPKKLGKNFKDNNKVVPALKPQEGDFILQGRFGNNIRFGNVKETGLPIIKIGNIDKQPEFKSVEESLDKDNCIWITTDEKLVFKAVGPKSDSRNAYPEKFETKQITVFSDQILFTSKVGNILGHSNAGILFTSNKNFGVDTSAQILLNSAKSFEVNSKEKTILTAPNTYIGSKDAKEALMLGNKAIALVGDILDAITQLTVTTGVGPSGPPINLAKFTAIKGKLDTIISKKHFTE